MVKQRHLILGIQLFAPILLVLGAEIMQRESINEVQRWIITNPLAVLINYTISFFLLMFLWSLIKNVYLSIGIYYLVGFLLMLINMYKMKILKEPLLPWDLFLYNQIISLLPNIYKETNYLFFVFLIPLLLLIILLFKLLPSLHLNMKYRLIGGGISILFLLSLIFYNSNVIGTGLQKLKIRNMNWNQVDNYQTNGLFLSFFLNIASAIIVAPQDYEEKKVNDILKRVDKENPYQAKNTSTTPHKKPNVIFIMNEAFSDPTLLKNISFRPDPLPTFHSLLKNRKASWMLTPQYGGGTANVEFEVLTGFNMSFLPSGSIPYQQYIHHSVPSLVSAFSGEGYNTIAIHPYERTFWNRHQVYNHFGFKEFISLENFRNPKKSGGYFVDDKEVTNSIIEQTKKSDQPVFIYAVTMQNHFSYHISTHKYPVFPIEVEGKVSEKSREALKVYANGLFDGDQQLYDLISYFKKNREPTILVFFGDHLPHLEVYKEAEFITSNQEKNMKTTPLVIWTNYGKQAENLYNTVSSSFVGTYVFELAGIKPPLFFRFLENFRNELPGYHSLMKLNKEGNMVEKLPKEIKKMEKDYELLQYDLLFGKQYANKFK